VPTVFKSVSLSLLEPSRPLQACNGIALPILIKMKQILHTKIKPLITETEDWKETDNIKE
jgi:hypothetical protein